MTATTAKELLYAAGYNVFINKHSPSQIVATKQGTSDSIHYRVESDGQISCLRSVLTGNVTQSWEEYIPGTFHGSI